MSLPAGALASMMLRGFCTSALAAGATAALPWSSLAVEAASNNAAVEAAAEAERASQGGGGSTESRGEEGSSSSSSSSNLPTGESHPPTIWTRFRKWTFGDGAEELMDDDDGETAGEVDPDSTLEEFSLEDSTAGPCSIADALKATTECAHKEGSMFSNLKALENQGLARTVQSYVDEQRTQIVAAGSELLNEIVNDSSVEESLDGLALSLGKDIVIGIGALSVLTWGTMSTLRWMHHRYWRTFTIHPSQSALHGGLILFLSSLTGSEREGTWQLLLVKSKEVDGGAPHVVRVLGPGTHQVLWGNLNLRLVIRSSVEIRGFNGDHDHVFDSASQAANHSLGSVELWIPVLENPSGTVDELLHQAMSQEPIPASLVSGE